MLLSRPIALKRHAATGRRCITTLIQSEIEENSVK